MRNRRCAFRNLLTLLALFVPADTFICRPSAASAFSGTGSPARRAACKASRHERQRSVMGAQGGGGKGDHYVSEAGAKLNKGVKHVSLPPHPPTPFHYHLAAGRRFVCACLYFLAVQICTMVGAITVERGTSKPLDSLN